MSKFTLRSLSGVLTVAIAAGLAGAADEVLRKGETTALQGKVGEITKTTIELESIGSIKKPPVTIPANAIVRIKWDGEPPALNLVRNQEDGGQLKAALDEYKKIAPTIDAGKTNLKTDLEFLIARTTAKLAGQDPTQLDEALKLLEGFKSAHSSNFRFYEVIVLLGNAYRAKSDYANANTNFALLTQAPWPDFKLAGQNAQGRVLLDQGKTDEALAAFEAVIAAAGNAAEVKSRKYEAMLGKAACLQKKGQSDQAAKTLEEVVHNASSENARVQAEAYLRRGDAFLAQGKKKEALHAYLHVDVLFSSETDLHAEALYHLVSLWKDLGSDDRAKRAADVLSSFPQTNVWRKKLAGG